MLRFACPASNRPAPRQSVSVPASETSAAGTLSPAQCCCLKAPASARCLPAFLSYSIVYVRDQVVAPFVPSPKRKRESCHAISRAFAIEFSTLFFHRAASLAILSVKWALPVPDFIVVQQLYA